MDESVIAAFGRRPVTSANAVKHTDGVDVRSEYKRKFEVNATVLAGLVRALTCGDAEGGVSMLVERV